MKSGVKPPHSKWSREIRRQGIAALQVVCILLSASFALAVDKSGVTPNTISLPKGPGSIEGLGESFEPALNNGTSKYSVPLKVPPGTAGHTPAVSLHYDSGNGNGPLGFGWEIPIPYVQRQTDKGIPRYVDAINGVDDDLDGTVDEPDEVDRFIEETKEELVPQANGDYFCENEGAFVRYRRVGDHWEATRPDGTRLVFGATEAARVEGANPLAPVTFKWLLEREMDTHGNSIVYAYTNFPGTENTNQVYLSSIRYGPGAPPWTNYHFITFQYGPRSDWFEDGRAGFLVRTGVRLTNIVVGTHGPDLSPYGHLQAELDGQPGIDNLDRMYALSYSPTDHGPPITNHFSFLTSVTPVGTDGTNALPPSTFGYGVVNPPDTVSAFSNIIGSINEPPMVMDNPLVDLVDLNGDGLPDVLKTAYAGGAHMGWINKGQVVTGTTATASSGANGFAPSIIQWDGPHDVLSADGLAWTVNLEDGQKIAHLADLDGDGVSDLWVKDAADQVHSFRNTSGLAWEPRQAMSIQDFTPPAPFSDGNVTTADMNFDKRIDIIQSIDVGGMAGYQIWYNLGSQRYSARQTVPQNHALLFGLSNVELTDFNGDRVPDITRIRVSTVEVGAGLGYGRFSPIVSIPIPDATLTTEQLGKAKLRDITGDGLADLVVERAEPGTLWYWVNLGNETFSTRKVINGLPTSMGASVAVRWADINGNGTLDLIYADSTGSPRIQAVDIGTLIGCGADRNLLKVIDNGIGGRTYIGYGSSTDYLLQDWAILESSTLSNAVPLSGSKLSSAIPLEGGNPLPPLVENAGTATIQSLALNGGKGLPPSSVVSAAERLAALQFRAWPDPLPFPVTVVARVIRDDSLGSLYTNTYAYHDGYYDPVEKEFRGFGRVEVTEQGDDSAPTLVTRSRFDTGWRYEAMKGKLLRLTTEQGTGGMEQKIAENAKGVGTGVFQDSFTAWADPPRLLMTGINSQEVRFAHAVASSNVICELGQGVPRALLSRMAYDDYGNQTLDADYGIVDGDWDDERITTNVYAINTNAWILRALASQEIQNEQGAVVARTENYYDDPTFGGANFRVVTTGDLTMVRRWVDPDGSPGVTVTPLRNVYDTYGNITAIHDALSGVKPGHTRQLDYDPVFHVYPISEMIQTGKTNPPTLTITAAYDVGLATVTSSRNPNGFSTFYGYDSFGRLTSITRPGDTTNLPTAEFAYVLNHPLEGGNLSSAIPLEGGNPLPPQSADRSSSAFTALTITGGMGMPPSINWIATRARETAGTTNTVDSRTFFDGLGRKLMTRAEGEFAGQVVVSDTVQFNARRLPRRVYLPYFETNSTLDYVAPSFSGGYTEHFYDALGRPVRVNQPADAASNVVFSTVTYEPLSRTVHDEEQTDTNSLHAGCGMRYVEDGLQDKDGKGRLREVYEIVRLTDNGEPGPLTNWPTIYTYDLLDNWTGYTDSQNNRKFVTYDGLSRKVFMNDPDRGYLWWAYDDVGNVIRRRDAKDQEIAYTYDGVNRLTAEYYCTNTECVGGAETNRIWTPPTRIPARSPDVAYHYDIPAGPVDRGAWWTKGAASSIAAAVLDGIYDPAHDLNGDGVVDVADAVLAARTATVTASNTLGYLAWVRDQSGEEHNSYDPRGRVSWVVKGISTNPPTDNRSLITFFTGFAYDSMDRVTELTYPDRTTLSYSYNSRGLLESMPNVLATLDYNPAGQNAQLALACGTETTYAYDHRLRLKRLSTVRTRDSRVLQDFNYAFDRVSNITEINDGRSDADLLTIGVGELGISTNEARQFNATQYFLYDSLYRLIQSANPGVYGAIDHRYDRIGNMRLQNAKTAALAPIDPMMDLGGERSGGDAGPSNRVGRIPFAGPGPHAITGTERGPEGPQVFAYDGNGNMTTNLGATYVWDHNDRLMAIHNGPTNASYTYDYTGTRKLKCVSTNTSHLTPDTLYVDQFSELRDNTLIKYAYAGANRIARSSSPPSPISSFIFHPSSFFLHDHLGSTHFAIGTNATTQEQCVNYPFGYPRLERYAPAPGKSVDYGFTGKERDVESGLQYFEARYLNGSNGRWVSVDPLVERATVNRSRNGYAYVNAHTLSFYDPDGRDLVKVGFSDDLLNKRVFVSRSGTQTDRGVVVDRNLVPKLEKLVQKLVERGYDLKMVSSYRSLKEQQAEAQNNSLATSGTSSHSAGLALDIHLRKHGEDEWANIGNVDDPEIKKLVDDLGMRWGKNFNDAPHIDASPPGAEREMKALENQQDANFSLWFMTSSGDDVGDTVIGMPEQPPTRSRAVQAKFQ